MSLVIEPWTPADHDAVRALLAEPSIAAQNDMLVGPGRLEHWLADPFCDPAARFVARLGGEPAGFAYAFLLRSSTAPWAMLRPNVAERFRRRGVGTRLLAAQLAAIAARMPDCVEVCTGAFEPCEPLAAFAAHHGFRVVRRFWLMQRPDAPVPDPEWPADVTVRTYVPVDADLRDWTNAYNASFARHYHFVPATEDEARGIAASPEFDADSLALAYDTGGRCVGFCRNEYHATRGEVGSLGVVPEAQGRGLGRALLRWGVRRLLERGARPVTLLVDGENEGALGLYRSEGFAIAKTRLVWSRAPF
jgi:mycothiol synthase